MHVYEKKFVPDNPHDNKRGYGVVLNWQQDIIWINDDTV